MNSLLPCELHVPPGFKTVHEVTNANMNISLYNFLRCFISIITTN